MTVNVYVVVSNQPDNQGAHSIWSTQEAAQAECDRENARGGADRYSVDVYELDLAGEQT